MRLLLGVFGVDAGRVGCGGGGLTVEDGFTADVGCGFRVVAVGLVASCRARTVGMLALPHRSTARTEKTSGNSPD